MATWRRHLMRGAVLVGGRRHRPGPSRWPTRSPAVRPSASKSRPSCASSLSAARWPSARPDSVCSAASTSKTSRSIARTIRPRRRCCTSRPASSITTRKQLAHGRLAIRKLLIQRPRITITRSADGRWNLAGIVGPVHPELQIPIIEIEQATVVIEIGTHTATTPFRIELRNVNATLLNQPRLVLNIEVHGEAVELGPVHANATWHRTAKRLDATVDLAPVPVTTALLRDLSRFCPGLADQVDQVCRGRPAPCRRPVQPCRRAAVAAPSTGRTDQAAGWSIATCRCRSIKLIARPAAMTGRCRSSGSRPRPGTADVALCCRFREPGDEEKTRRSAIDDRPLPGRLRIRRR